MAAPLSILLLEDDPSSIRLFHRKIQTAPIEMIVKDVRNKEGFIRELETPNFDCIVVDYTLPDINGIEALHIVKEMAPGTPTIIYTGSVGEEKAVECMKEGAAEFLLKTNSVRLVPAIISVVNQRRDYLARLKAEEAQKQSEARFQALAETSTAAILVYQDDKLVYINSVAEKITGYTIEELKQIHFLELIHPDHKEMVKEYGEARRRGKDAPTRYEFKIVTKQGEIRWLEFALGSINYDNGTAILGIAFDVTARKKAEEQLQASEVRYRTLFEANPNPMWLFDVETKKFLAVNDAAVSHYGYSRDEFLSMTMMDIVPPEESISFEEHLKQGAESNGLFRCSLCKQKKKNGEVIEVDAISHKLEFDGHSAMMVLAMDVTDRRRTEEALRISEANYRSLFESANDIIFTLSLDGKITALNPAFETLTNLKRENYIGKHFSEIVIPEDIAHANETIQRVLLGLSVASNEYKMRTASDEFLIIEIKMTLQIRGGLKVGILGVGRDVSEQRRMEQQFRQAQKMESIGTLAGGIAHDFNNIMGIVFGYISLAEQHAGDAEKIRQDIEMIRTASDRGAALVRQLLTFARKSSVIFELTDINIVVKELIPMLQATFPKTVELQLELTEPLPPISADKNQLQQALLNIAVNARDALPKGGNLKFVTNLVTGEKLRERISNASSNDYIHLAISDNGIGMDEDTKNKAFDPFFTTKHINKGTGLGLAVVYGIVSSHNGFVDIETEIEKGTTVNIYLPASLSKREPLKSVDSFKDVEGGKETILIAEDEIALRKYLKVLLDGKGYTVLEAPNGLDALEIYKQYQKNISLIITDYGMPKLDGLGLLKKVMEIEPFARVVLTSGFVTPEQRSELLRAGAIDIIMKPYKADEILERIRVILDLKR